MAGIDHPGLSCPQQLFDFGTQNKSRTKAQVASNLELEFRNQLDDAAQIFSSVLRIANSKGVLMKNEDTQKQPQTTQQQPKQPGQRTTDTSENNPAKTGENKGNPQDISKKNPTQVGGSPQHQDQEKSGQDKHEKAS